ncbi:MAG: YgaP family membrane protein [Nanobdellota archaeon]
MKADNMVKLIAGIFITLSAFFGFFNEYWLIITIFIGINLFQYSITGFCPMKMLLLKLGMKE